MGTIRRRAARRAPTSRALRCPGSAALPPAIGLALGAGIAWLLWRRWYWATRHERLTLGPVLLTGGVSLALLVVAGLVDRSSAAGGRAIGWVAFVAFGTVPSPILAGIVRGRLARASVAELLRELETARTPGALSDALRHALGDPTLRLAYWVSESRGFVDLRGRPFELPWEGSNQVATRVERDGRCVAAIVHDASLRDAPELLGAVTSRRPSRSRTSGSTPSSVRIWTTCASRGPASSRRVTPSGGGSSGTSTTVLSSGSSDVLRLRLVEAKIRTDPEETVPIVAELRRELTEALEELREWHGGSTRRS